ncbi:MAG: glutathione S-transferase family protein [Devosia sp.]
MTITLWGRPSSSNVQKVRWALAELGLEHEHVLAGGKFGGNNTPEYLAMNPNGLVPTLRDGDLVLWESHAILRYLSAEYGRGRLWPESPKARAKADQWTDWAATTLLPAFSGVFWNLVRTPEPQRDEKAIARHLAETERCLTMLDAELGRSAYLGGAEFSYGDIPSGMAMFRWTSMDIARQSHPNGERWHAQLRERRAYRDMVEVVYSELAGRLSF